MPNKTMSYLTRLLLILLVVVMAPESQAQTMYLEPDTVYITDGPGAEFDLALRVDAAVTDLKLFVAELNYDATKLDTVVNYDTVSTEPLDVDTTVLITEGDFWDATGMGTFFGWRFRDNDSTLRLENLVLGAGIAADGPGLLASITLAAKDTGRVDLYFKQGLLKDVNGAVIPSTSVGAVVFIDYPPTPFNLIEPAYGETIFGSSGETIVLTWGKATSVYPGEGVLYDLEISRSADFEPGSTDVYTGLSDTTYTLYIDDLTEGAYYWRVTAVGILYGFERISDPIWSWFGFNRYPPGPFSLLSPIAGELVERLPDESIDLVWSESVSPYVEESVVYTLEIAPNGLFLPGETITVSGLTTTTHTLSVNDLRVGFYYWRVTAFGDTYGLLMQSDPFGTYFEFTYIAVWPEAFELTHPIDGAIVNIYGLDEVLFQWEEALSIVGSDVITYSFYLGSEPDFPGSEIIEITGIVPTEINVDKSLLPVGEWQYWRVNAINNYGLNTWSTSTFSALFILRGDFDSGGQVNVTDLVDFVKYTFQQGPPPPFEETLDMDCDGQVDVSDLVFLVHYMFHQGEAPFCNIAY